MEQLKTSGSLGAYSTREPVETEVQLALARTIPAGIGLAQKQPASVGRS